MPRNFESDEVITFLNGIFWGRRLIGQRKGFDFWGKYLPLLGGPTTIQKLTCLSVVFSIKSKFCCTCADINWLKSLDTCLSFVSTSSPR